MKWIDDNGRSLENGYHPELAVIILGHSADIRVSARSMRLNNRNAGSSLVVHSDSISAIARVGHTRAGPGQEHAVRAQRWVTALSNAIRKRTVDLVWVKGHAGTPGNERTDQLAGKAAEMVGTHTTMSLSHIRLRIPRGEGRVACRPGTPRHRGDSPTAPEEVDA
jgi:hypothetical protein